MEYRSFNRINTSFMHSLFIFSQTKKSWFSEASNKFFEKQIDLGKCSSFQLNNGKKLSMSIHLQSDKRISKVSIDENFSIGQVIQAEECSERCLSSKWETICNCYPKLYGARNRLNGSLCEYLPHCMELSLFIIMFTLIREYMQIWSFMECLADIQ